MTMMWKLGIAGENAGNKSKPNLHVCWISAVYMVEGLGSSFPQGPYGVQMICGEQRSRDQRARGWPTLPTTQRKYVAKF
jgi:hypothetical protein